MKFSSALLVSCLELGFAGCAHSGKPKPTPVLDTGLQPLLSVPASVLGVKPTGYTEVIMNALRRSPLFNRLDDYQFAEPQPAVVQDTGVPGHRQNHYGWVVKVAHTPRPLPPSYIGPRYQYFMFAEGHVADITQAFITGLAAYVSIDPTKP